MLKKFSAAALTVPAHHGAKTNNLCRRRNQGCDTGCHRACKNIAVVDVHELVPKNAAHFAFVKKLQDTLGAADGGIARIAPSREGVWSLGGCHI